MAYNKPLPIIDNWNRGFWDAARDNKLAAPECDDCKKLFFPSGPCCPYCISKKINWRHLSGKGQIESWTIFHKLYYKGFSEDLPYNVAVIILDEGISMMSNVIGIDNSNLKHGMKVEVVFEMATDEITIPKFRAINTGVH